MTYTHSLEGHLDLEWRLNAPLGRTGITRLEIPVSWASRVNDGFCRCTGNGKEETTERKETVDLEVLRFGQSREFELL